MLTVAVRFCLLCALVLPAVSVSQEIYKTVDAEGRVTYSSTPPAAGTAATVERVRIDPPPTEAQRAEAEARLRELEQASARNARERQEQRARRQNEVSADEGTLHRAQTELNAAKREATKTLRYGDTGPDTSRQTNLDRAEAAEKRIEEAEQGLRRTRRGGAR